MSTRANIIVEDSNVVIYKHWDGYPEATLPHLKTFKKRFNKDRGYDPEYEIAQIVREFARVDTIDETLEGHNESQWYLGWGLSDVLNSAVEYIYYLRKKGSVEVYKPTTAFWDECTLDNCELVKIAEPTIENPLAFSPRAHKLQVSG